MAFNHIECDNGCAPVVAVHFHDQKGHNRSFHFDDDRLGSLTIHEVRQFDGIVCDASREAGFIDLQQKLEIRIGGVSN